MQSFSAVPSGLDPRLEADPRLESLGYFQKSLWDKPKSEVRPARGLRASTQCFPVAAMLCRATRIIFVRRAASLRPWFQGFVREGPGLAECGWGQWLLAVLHTQPNQPSKRAGLAGRVDL